MKDKLTRKQRLIWLIPIAVLLTVYNQCKAQEKISIGVYQDARLLFLGDDKGNDALTLDAKIDVSLQGIQHEWYYFEIRPQFEYSNLKGGKYVSWQINGGWVLNKLFLNNLEAGAYLTIGAIHRNNGGYGTYGVTGDLSYKLTDRLKLSMLGQVINRNDLVELYNVKNSMRGSFYIGIKYNILEL